MPGNTNKIIRVDLFNLFFVAVFLTTNFSNATALAGQSCEVYFSPKATETLLKKKDRPEIEDVEKLDPFEVAKYLNSAKTTENDSKFYKVLEAVTIELLKGYRGEDIYFVARDGEWFYDAMTTVLSHNPNTQNLSDRIHLLNLSRPVAQNADPATLMKYLKANGLDPELILAGKKTATLVDTGERGSIFVALMQKIVQTQNFKGKDWRHRLVNLIKNLDVRLLHSSEVDNRIEVAKTLAEMDSFDVDQVVNEIEAIGFPALIVDKRGKIGIPESHYQLHSWIVEAFERRKHWHGRATNVSSSGKVTAYESNDQDVRAALYSQAKIISYFSQSSKVAVFAKVISSALQNCKAACITSRELKVVENKVPAKNVKSAEAKKVSKIDVKKIEIGIDFEPGDIVETNAKVQYEIVKYVDAGKRGKVYLARVLNEEGTVAIKVGVNSEAETLVSFAEEAEKNKGYKLADFPHAKLIELGQGYMVKEFIDGTRADKWLNEWMKAGIPGNTKELRNLSKLLQKSAERGIYIGDLNPKNLIWTGKNWVIVDSGSWRNDLSETEILARFQEKVVSRWVKNLPTPVQEKLTSELGLGE